MLEGVANHTGTTLALRRRMSSLARAITVALALSHGFALSAGSSAEAQWQPPPEPHEGFPHMSYEQTRVRWGVLAPGVALFAVGWLSNGIAGALAGTCPPSFSLYGSSCTSDPAWGDFRAFAAVPLIGPWLQLGAKPTNHGADGWVAWLVVDGIVQLAGLTMIVAALLNPRRVVIDVPNGLSVKPELGPDRAGAVLVGVF
jgi:hypothetical protein